MDENLKIIVSESEGGIRIDKLLVSYLPDHTRSKITLLIESECVFVNGKIAQKSYKTKVNDVISVIIPKVRDCDITAENIPLDVIFEDDDIIVVNKPKGMVVHPAQGNMSGTLVNALLYHCKGSLSGINGVMRPGIVHRIDKDTSGLLVVAKNDISHNGLASQFKDHSIEREYRTILFGNVKNHSGTVVKPIGRHPVNRKMMACVEKNSKNAVTHYEVIEHFNGFTYVKCNLETGRTHQIRVHMSNIGHFVIGDLIYGRKINKINLDFEGQCLHAKTLGFIHPVKNEFMKFDSELPNYFLTTLNKLKFL